MMANARGASPVVSPTLLVGLGIDEAACAPGSQRNLGVEGFTLDSSKRIGIISSKRLHTQLRAQKIDTR